MSTNVGCCKPSRPPTKIRYKTGITVSGVGNRIAHNLVHHGPHMALAAGGNDHVVEYNEIHNAVYESGDAGAYYVGRDWTQRGNVLRSQLLAPDRRRGRTRRHDDLSRRPALRAYDRRQRVRALLKRSVFIGGGDDNIVTNNVFLDCWRSAHIDNRGMGWQKAFTDDPNSSINVRLRAMPVDSELWKSRYPNLAGVLDDEPNIPKRNVFARNISAGGIWDDIHKGTREYQTVEDNLVYAAADAVQLIKDDAAGWSSCG